jgi:hypothetical protein
MHNAGQCVAYLGSAPADFASSTQMATDACHIVETVERHKSVTRAGVGPRHIARRDGYASRASLNLTEKRVLLVIRYGNL